jgi:hypothetical protein
MALVEQISALSQIAENAPAVFVPMGWEGQS